MTVETLVAELEQDGIRLRAEGEKLKLKAPADKVPSAETIAGLRENRNAVLEYLKERSQSRGIQSVSLLDPIPRKTDKLEHWPIESVNAKIRFGQAHARLFPFIGRKVRTPNGPGTLIQVFAEKVTVLLDTELTKCKFFTPDEIQPANWFA
jgi:hypothetical protein